jgi:hypothetical protein
MMLPALASTVQRQDKTHCALTVLSTSLDKTETHLDLRSKLLNNEPLRQLSDFLDKHPQITALNLSCNKSIEFTAEDTEVLCSILSTHGHVKALNLSNNTFPMPCLKKLCGALSTDCNTSLEQLNLASLELDQECIELLVGSEKENHSLRILNLGRNKCYSTGAIALSKQLSKYKHLQYLNFSMNDIEDKGAQAIAKALAINQSLISLELSYNNIKKEGALALAEALKTNRSLTRLGLSYNKINQAKTVLVGTPRGRHIPTLSALCLSGAQAFCDALKDNHTLVYLRFEDSRTMDEQTNTPRYLNRAEQKKLNSNINSYLARNKDRILATMFFACAIDKQSKNKSSEGITLPVIAAAADGRIAPELVKHVMSFLVGDRVFRIKQKTSKLIFKPRLIEPAPQLLREIDKDKPLGQKQAFWLVRACKLWNQAEMQSVGEAYSSATSSNYAGHSSAKK